MVKLKSGGETRQNKLYVYLSWLNSVRYGVRLTEMTCSVPNRLNPYIIVILQKPVKKFTAFYAGHKVQYCVQCVPPLSLSWARRIQSTLSNLTSWIFILTLSCHSCLGLSRGLFASGLSSKSLHATLFSPLHATYCTNLIFLHLIFRATYKCWK